MTQVLLNKDKSYKVCRKKEVPILTSMSNYKLSDIYRINLFSLNQLLDRL